MQSLSVAKITVNVQEIWAHERRATGGQNLQSSYEGQVSSMVDTPTERICSSDVDPYVAFVILCAVRAYGSISNKLPMTTIS